MSQAILELPTARRPVMREVASSAADRAEAAREHRLDRLRKVVCIRLSIAENTYENDLKLSVALDRLMDELMRG